MHKEILVSVREWRASVFQRWWDMLNIPFALIPLITGAVLIISWASKATPAIPQWYIYTFGGGIILFVILSFLSFHQMRLERDGYKLKATTNPSSKTETLLEMRSSKFYSVTGTLDAMRERMDELCISNTKSINREALPDLISDIGNITGATTQVNKILQTGKTTLPQLRSMQKSMDKKWGDTSSPNDPNTINLMNEITGILKHYKVDVITLSKRDRKYRKLTSNLPSERRLVLCDGTYNTIERYMFYLEGYGNIFMQMLIWAMSVDINTILTTEDKYKFAQFKQAKNKVLTNILKDVTLSIDTFIKDSVKGA